MHRFFAADPLDANYAATVWVMDQDTVQYRWQLARLSDGRSRDGAGTADSPIQARWAGLLAAVDQLQGAIRRAGRQVGDFKLEVRLPGIGGRGMQIVDTAPPDLRQKLQAFGSIHVITLESAAHG